MLLNLLGLAALVFLAYVFFTLLLRVLRSRHLAARVLGGLLSAALTLVFVAALGIALLGIWRVEAPRALAAANLTVELTPELVSQGANVAQQCIRCHSFDGGPILNGGGTNLMAALGPFGALYAPNLTPGGRVARWSDGEIMRATREGRDDRGALLLHPYTAFSGMSDADAQALVAYLRSQPALRHDQPRRNLNLLAWFAAGLGRLPSPQ